MKDEEERQGGSFVSILVVGVLRRIRKGELIKHWMDGHRKEWGKDQGDGYGKKWSLLVETPHCFSKTDPRPTHPRQPGGEVL